MEKRKNILIGAPLKNRRQDNRIRGNPTPNASQELCITHKFSNRSPSNPNGIPPQSPGLGGTTYPGNNVQEAFSTPKVLRQSSAIWAQPRWGCFEAGPRTQGRPAAVAEGQPWAGGRNPVGIKGNEAVPQIANLWVMHSSKEEPALSLSKGLGVGSAPTQ